MYIPIFSFASLHNYSSYCNLLLLFIIWCFSLCIVLLYLTRDCVKKAGLSWLCYTRSSYKSRSTQTKSYSNPAFYTSPSPSSPTLQYSFCHVLTSRLETSKHKKDHTVLLTWLDTGGSNGRCFLWHRSYYAIPTWILSWRQDYYASPFTQGFRANVGRWCKFYSGVRFHVPVCVSEILAWIHNVLSNSYSLWHVLS